MDNQCDRCGRELPKEQMPELGYEPGEAPECWVGFHIVIGGDNVIFPDSETDWDPENEYDLCPQCKEEFLKLWQGWYREEKGGK